MINTRPIGEMFDYSDERGLHTLKVVHHIGCGPCYFAGTGCDDIKGDFLGYCSNKYRTDGKSVNFVEVKGGEG